MGLEAVLLKALIALDFVLLCAVPALCMERSLKMALVGGKLVVACTLLSGHGGSPLGLGSHLPPMEARLRCS